MPTYDYKCETCGHQFEVFQSMKDDRLTECPQEGCDGKVKRLIGTGAGIIFKGSGFYETDYRSDSYKAAAKADSGTGSSDSGGSGGGDSGSGSSGGDSSGSKTDSGKSSSGESSTPSKPASKSSD
ncbi:MAG: zinc ribbon domain-containing protein [Verrucomicrobiales bacterium]|nr:zinc ribbon domain-containing protein [Verrucomicrobiales bacterium]